MEELTVLPRGGQRYEFRGRQINTAHTCNSGNNTAENMERNTETIVKPKEKHMFGNLRHKYMFLFPNTEISCKIKNLHIFKSNFLRKTEEEQNKLKTLCLHFYDFFSS